MIEYKSLEATNIEILHNTFIKAFSDYQVKIIYSPDYDKNPFEDRSENLTKSFYIQMIQNELLHKTQCIGSPATFQDTMRFNKKRVYY